MLGIIKAFTHAVKGISVLLKQMMDTLLSGIFLSSVTMKHTALKINSPGINFPYKNYSQRSSNNIVS